jgi:hypothetical protein
MPPGEAIMSMRHCFEVTCDHIDHDYLLWADSSLRARPVFLLLLLWITHCDLRRATTQGPA